MNLMYSDVIGAKRNIGITLTGTYHSQPVNAIVNKNLERKNVGQSAFTRWAAPWVAPRTQLASGLKVDYRWSDRTIISFNTSYNFSTKTTTRRRRRSPLSASPTPRPLGAGNG
jgi:hypothetical protein